MNTLWLLLIVVAIYLIFYFVYGKYVERKIVCADNNCATPSHRLNDGIDYVPTHKFVLFGHHFASIAGASPIVGPILALIWGWVPALLWILFGNIFIGAIHDYLSLAASIRHEGKSIQWIARKHIKPSTGTIFAWFILFVLVLVVAAFSSLIGSTFVKSPQVALASILFMAVALLFSLIFYRFKTNFILSTVIGVLMMGGAIWISTIEFTAPADMLVVNIPAGGTNSSISYYPVLDGNMVTPLPAGAMEYLPTNALKIIDAASYEGSGLNIDPSVRIGIISIAGQPYIVDARVPLSIPVNPFMTPKAIPWTVYRSGESLGYLLGIPLPYEIWLIILLVYIIVAASLPVTVLLQPRDYLNSWILYIGIFLGGAALLVLHQSMTIPDFTAFTVPAIAGKPTPFWPIIPLIIACGSLSGFHSLVASGTTAKQLDKEKDALFIGFGGMLTEGLLAALVVLLVGSSLFFIAGDKAGMITGVDNYVKNYNAFLKASGDAVVLFSKAFGYTVNKAFGISVAVMTTLAALWVASFALTTLDTTNRLARYIVSELAEPLKNKSGGLFKFLSNRWTASFIPAFLGIVLAWSGTYTVIWPAFGGANQMLASIALITIASWVMKKDFRSGLIALIPAIFLWITVTAALFWYLIAVTLPSVQAAANAQDILTPLLVGIIVAVMLVLNFILIIDFWSVIRKKPSIA
ncbi:MAG: carbon starvation protein A [Brevinematales bacterium]|nr:carbon starvation protein A [Brevinematales bacterium]